MLSFIIFHKARRSQSNNCGVSTKYKPEDLSPGDKRRKERPSVQYHVLYPDTEFCQHEDYMKDRPKNDFKTYPQPDNKVARHNGENVSQFLRQLKAIVEKANGFCGP